MVAPVKTQLTIREQKRRESWERNVKIAYAHVESMKNNHRIYINEATNIKNRYVAWLKENRITPIMDLTQYK